MTALGNINGRITVNLGDNEPIEVATFETPLKVTGTDDGNRRGTITINGDLRTAIATALREIADSVEQDG